MRQGLWGISGFLVWGSALSALYGLLSLLCVWTFSAAVTFVLLLILWLAHLAVNGAIVLVDVKYHLARRDRTFGASVALGANAAAFGATLFTGLPIVLTSPTC